MPLRRAGKGTMDGCRGKTVGNEVKKNKLDEILKMGVRDWTGGGLLID